MNRFALQPRRGTVDSFKKYGKFNEENDFKEGEQIVLYDKKLFLLVSMNKDIDQLVDEWYSPKTKEVIELNEYYYAKNNLSNLITASSIVTLVALYSVIIAILNGIVPVIIFSGIFFVLFGISLIKNIKDMKELKKPEILKEWEKRHGKSTIC